MMTVDQVLNEVEQLSEGDQVLLLDRLAGRRHPVDPENEAAWSSEIQRRVAELESGQVREIPGEEVTARIRRKLGL